MKSIWVGGWTCDLCVGHLLTSKHILSGSSSTICWSWVVDPTCNYHRPRPTIAGIKRCFCSKFIIGRCFDSSVVVMWDFWLWVKTLIP